MLRSESLALESAKVPEGRAKVPESRWLRLGSVPRSLRHVVTKVPDSRLRSETLTCPGFRRPLGDRRRICFPEEASEGFTETIEGPRVSRGLVPQFS